MDIYTMVKNLRMRKRSWAGVLSWIALLCCFGMTATQEEQNQLQCYSRDSSDGRANPKAVEKEPEVKACDSDIKFCFLVYSNDTGVPRERVMGCWPHDGNDQPSCHKNECSISKGAIFCCCAEPLCNRLVDFDTAAILVERTTPREEEKKPIPSNIQYTTMIMSLVPVIAITFIVILAFWLYRRHKFPHEPLATQDPNPHINTAPTLQGLRPVQLKEIKASGRFGCVWKAQMWDETVAVKIFPLQELKSFTKECDIYNLASINNHSSILRFIGAEKRGDNLNMELWLITEFHEKGSLYDYLKRHLLTWSEALHMSTTMANGLAFLHDIVPANGNSGPKEAIAHRDFKSKNVLVKADLSACIADFGLAVKFQTGKTDNVIQGQVGTRRYMSPEVLEGSVNLSVEFFFKIDMYACGLVLWEILTRCSANEGPIEDYQLPFEKEVGLRPTLEEMQECVIYQMKRPELKEAWLKDPNLSEFCSMVEECWDSDADARLSAYCVLERLMAMQKRSNLPSSVSQFQSSTPHQVTLLSQQQQQHQTQPQQQQTAPVRPPPHMMTYLPTQTPTNNSSMTTPLESSGSSTSATCSSTSTQDSGITLGPPTTTSTCLIMPHAPSAVLGNSHSNPHNNINNRGHHLPSGPGAAGEINGTAPPPLSVMVPSAAASPPSQIAITSIYPPRNYTNAGGNNQGSNVTTTIASSIPPQAV